MTPTTAPAAVALPVPDPIDVAALVEELGAQGVRIVRGTFVDSAGVLRAKQVSLPRLGNFASPGLGAAPSWAVFCVDDAIAFTPAFSAVGDMRLRIDLGSLRRTDHVHAWGPIELVDQQGRPLAFCPRTVLRRQLARGAAAGISVRAAIELEFVCFDAQSGAVVPGVAYGARPLFESAAFLDDLHGSFDAAGLSLEQLHAEYGAGQFELSIAPADPLAAADAHVCARLLVSDVARRHGRLASFSPQALAQGIGNGAHAHFSYERAGRPLLSGGHGPYGLTDDGAAIVAALVAGLPDAIGVLAPSVLSMLRLQPGHWAGAFSCWGLENREAAIRLCEETPGNPHGAHLEVKCLDPSANVYAAMAVLVGLALDGLVEEHPFPEETTVDPQTLDDDMRAAAGIVALGGDHASVLDALEGSATMTRLLGEELVDALVAVRRHEVEMGKGQTAAELVDQLRYAWSAIEGVGICAMVVLAIVILSKGGAPHTGLTTSVFSLKGSSFTAVMGAVVAGFLSWAGFEGCAALGEETDKPRKNIPRALTGAIVLTGILFVLMMYVQTVGYGTSAAGLHTFETQGNSLATLGATFVGTWFELVISFAALMSAFACHLSSAATSGRLMFAFSRDGFGPRAFSRLDRRQGSPLWAVGFVLLLSFGVDFVSWATGHPVVGTGNAALDSYFYFATIGAMTLMMAYLFVEIGTIFQLARERKERLLELIFPVLGGALMISVFYFNVKGQMSALAAVFVAFMIAAVGLGMTFFLPGLATKVGQGLSAELGGPAGKELVPEIEDVPAGAMAP